MIVILEQPKIFLEQQRLLAYYSNIKAMIGKLCHFQITRALLKKRVLFLEFVLSLFD